MYARSLVLLLLFFSVPAVHSEEAVVGKTSVPDWAIALEVEPFASDRSSEHQRGVALLLSDRQIRKTSTGFDFFERAVYRVTERSGLETASRITWSFDPSEASLAFNHVRVRRDGRSEDRLADAEILVLRQETGLQGAMLDGLLTAVIDLEDIRVGDEIDFALSGSVATRLWPDEYFDIVSTEWPYPIAQSHYRLDVPAALELSIESSATKLEPEILVDGDRRIVVLHQFDPEPVRAEPATPADYLDFGLVAITSMGEWEDVARWGMGIIDVDRTLPRSFRRRIDRLTRRAKTPSEKATRILRLVQEEIRYLGIEVGLGSHVPRTPMETLENGFGDCKDKSILLIAALAHVGIDAHAALASLFNGAITASLPPSVGSFDHMIVGIELPEQTIWVDPTLSHQAGDITRAPVLDYRNILPLKPDAALVDLQPGLSGLPTLVSTETFVLPEDENSAMELRMVDIHRDVSADNMRLNIATAGRATLEQNYVDYYRRLYGGLEITRPIEIEDDTETNRIRVTLGLELPANMVAMSGLREELEVFNSTLQGTLPSRMNSARSEPLALPGSVHLEHRIRIETPGRSLPPPPGDVMTAPGVRYERAFGSSADTLEMRFNLQVDAYAAPASAIREVSDISDAIARDGEMRVRVGAARTKEALKAAAAAAADPVVQAIDEIRELMAQNDEVTALTLTNRLLADTETLTDVQRGGLLQLKGMLLIRLNRNTAALTPLREGLQLSPADAPAPYFMLIGALGKAQRLAEVPAVFNDLLTHHPSAITTLRPRFVNRLVRELRNESLEAERTEMLLALAAAIAATPDADAHPYQYLLAEAVRTTSERPELGDARAIAARIEQPQLIAQLLADRTTERIWDELEAASGAAMEQSIQRYLERAERDAEARPDDYQVLTRLLRAFRIAGRPEDAVAAGTAAVADWARIEAVAEDAYWFVNEYAYALREAGRLDEATAVLVRLTSLGVEENAPLISMSINLASLLLAAERYEAVLEQIEALESLQNTPASDFGWMWMYANRACALYRLGRVDEAERELAETMADVRDSNPSAETKALLCMERMDEAASLAIERLNDPLKRPAALELFTWGEEVTDAAPLLQTLDRRRRTLAEREDVAGALSIYGRALEVASPSTVWTRY